ncbi:Sortase family protein [Saccharopolyspora antimicrobica]|uniref:Sortase family protein n=1 Tax=Saccharopolyspora antimicrobica TaxID=455193 RepID=A0A1I4TVR4_9PSEU|nr:class F sortase [Saccharopolyspora antimicrobica]RKT88575.1 sortase family protein [Saccharopolyspora antimicrobica]SFM80812.1 Sortase family protein [Saccharopolyspora antimicrobica]
MRTAILLLWSAVLLAVAVAADPQPVDARSARPPAAAPAAAVPGDLRPRAIDLPSIDAESSLIPLGLNPDGSAEVPPIDQPGQAGWFRLGPGAGEVGPFVVLGHVDSYREAGVFHRLRDLRPGDPVEVERADGSRVTYVVDRMQTVAKDRFPTEAVYGDVARPEIRLITCGGAFDESRRSYEDNLIVYGHLR